MKGNKYPYEAFDRFVVRTPLYPFNDVERYDHHRSTPEFKEALFLASPSIYGFVDKSNEEKEADGKAEMGIQKYFRRACTRSTPFGLFAGCSVGQIGEDTKLEKFDISKVRRTTRLDMQYLCALVQAMAQDEDFRSTLLFYPNDTIYSVGDKLRYIEYRYKNSKRVHVVSSVEISDYLIKILEKAEEGMSIDQLATVITDEDITIDEALEYIGELIDNQLLKSELEPSVVGGDFLEDILRKLSRTPTSVYFQKLTEIDLLLKIIDGKPIGQTQFLYDKIIELIKEFKVKFEYKFLFQSDTYTPLKKNSVSDGIVEEIKKAITFMSKLSLNITLPNIESFKEAFYKRYEEEEVPLTLVLDSESGIGYPLNSGSGGVNALIDDLIVPPRIAPSKPSVNISYTDTVLLKKYITAIKSGESVIELTDSDFNGSIEGELPMTVPVMCHIFTENGRPKINIKSAGGPCAGNLIGRFCHLDPEILEIAGQIADKEQQSAPDVIFAEISHLPESRIGNIASRPLFRDYVIHYLSNTDTGEEKCIPVSDLMLSIKNNSLCLRSKKLNKRIIPRLTCAHNYSFSTIPVYRFLADFQSLCPTRSLALHPGEIFNLFDYFPRIVYGDVIFSEQRWNILKTDIEGCYKMDDQELIYFWKDFSEKKNIVQRVVLSEGDNEMYIDLSDVTSLKILLSLVSKKNTFRLKEFMFNGANSIIRSRNADFSNEFIFFFHSCKV